MKVRLLDGLDLLTCPFCGLRIVDEKATATFRHEEPQCAEFGKALLKRFPSFQAKKDERTMFVGTPAARRKP